MRLGGWTRIWIVLCVLYGALVTLIAYDSRPTAGKLQRDWLYEASVKIAETISETEDQYVSAADVEDRIKQRRGSAENTVVWLQQIETHPRPDQKAISTAVVPVNAKYKRRIEVLPKNQARFWGGAFLWWAGGCLLLFGMGWSIGWIFRGFRKGAA